MNPSGVREWMRRALARSCMIEMALESSMKMGALVNSSAASSSRSAPRRSSRAGRRAAASVHRAREQSMRSASCEAPISSEKISTAAGACRLLRQRGGLGEVQRERGLSIEGRAARLIFSCR